MLSSVVHRVGWAALALWVIVWLRGLDIPAKPTVWFGFLVMGMLNNVLPFRLMAWGQLYIESGLTSILNAVTAIFGVLVAALFFADERLTTMRLLGVALGFAGVVSVIGPEALTGFDLRSTAQLAVLAGTLSYAFAGVWGRLRLSDLSPLVAAAGMLTGALVVMLPLTLLREGHVDLPTTLRGTMAIAYYALIATAGAYLLYYRVLAQAGSGNLMLVTLVIPPVAIALGSWVLDETLNPNAYIGFGFLALGLVVVNIGGRRGNRPAPVA